MMIIRHHAYGTKVPFTVKVNETNLHQNRVSGSLAVLVNHGSRSSAPLVIPEKGLLFLFGQFRDI